MTPLPGETQGQAGHREDLPDHVDRETALGQRGALLDVQLDERARKRTRGAPPWREAPWREAPWWETRWWDAQGGQGLSDARSAGVTHLELAGVELAAECPAAEVALPEPPAFLVAERDDRDGSGVRLAGGRRDRLKPRDHAERAVITAAVGHGIEVGSGPHLREFRGGASGPADQVAPRVDGDLQPRLRPPAGPAILRLL